MKLKKMIASIMAMSMMAATMPVTVQAEEVVTEPAGEEVINEPSASVVAKISDKEYTTLAAAVEDADEGETVTLLESTEGAGIVIDKDITIDFDAILMTSLVRQ